MNTDDKELLCAYVRRKDTEAFTALVERYQSLVYSAGLRQLRNSADAEDVSQEVFLSLARNAHQISDGNLGGWLYRSAVNASNSKLRTDLARTKRERTREVPEQGPDELLQWRQIEEVLDICLAELDSDSRELVIQRFLVNRSQSELAESLGVDQATISRRLTKAVDQLRHKMVQRGVRLTAAAITASMTEHAAGNAVPGGLTAALTKIGVAGVGRMGTSAHPISTTSLSWPAMGIATVALLACVLALAVAVAKSHSGPTATVATLAQPPQFGVVAEMTHLDYSQSLSTSGLAIDSQGRVVTFNDKPVERAGLYIISNNRFQRLHPLPTHGHRSVALAAGPIAAFNCDGHIGVVDRDGMRPLTEQGAFDAPPSVNRQGWVAFIETAPVSCIRLAAGDGVRTLHQAGDRFARFHEVSINDAGQVAFRAEGVDGKDGLFVTHRGEVTTIAKVGEEFQELRPWLDFNDRGQVAFVATLADGSEALYVGDGDRLEQVAVSGNYFASILQATLNSAGSIAFTARKPGEPADSPTANLYWWDGKQVVELLPRWQKMGDHTLHGVILWRDSLNDAGQIAVVADYGLAENSAILRLETTGLHVAN